MDFFSGFLPGIHGLEKDPEAEPKAEPSPATTPEEPDAEPMPEMMPGGGRLGLPPKWMVDFIENPIKMGDNWA